MIQKKEVVRILKISHLRVKYQELKGKIHRLVKEKKGQSK